MVHKEKILIVEDERIISMHIEETLNNLGYVNIQTAFDAKSALEMMLNETFDIVLMDINLESEDDGIDVMNKIKKHMDIPFLYITSNSDLNTVTKAKHSEPNGFIIKPFSEIDLKINIEFTLYQYKNKKSKNNKLNLNQQTEQPLNMRVGPQGELYYINPLFEKITDIPVMQSHKGSLENSDLDPFFSSTITNIIHQVKHLNKYVFYSNIKTNMNTERIMEIVVTPENFENNSFQSFLLSFKDVTDFYAKDLRTGKEDIRLINLPLQTTGPNSCLKSLTNREKEILNNIVNGMSNKMIADHLMISPKTVSIHRTNIMKKLSAKNAADLVRMAIENDISKI